MATRTLGTTSTTALTAVVFNPPNVLAAADLASVGDGMLNDLFAATATGGVLTTLNIASGSATATPASLTRIQPGMQIFATGVPLGTFVLSVGASTIVMSNNATANNAAANAIFAPQAQTDQVGFSFEGLLTIPRRGILKVLPGDIVAVDNTGWPILVSANAVAYAGSLYSLV